MDSEIVKPYVPKITRFKEGDCFGKRLNHLMQYGESSFYCSSNNKKSAKRVYDLLCEKDLDSYTLENFYEDVLKLDSFGKTKTQTLIDHILLLGKDQSADPICYSESVPTY